ncbi:hypothetical protein CR513_40341, partial [Mucuna pruriens]
MSIPNRMLTLVWPTPSTDSHSSRSVPASKGRIHSSNSSTCHLGKQLWHSVVSADTSTDFNSSNLIHPDTSTNFNSSDLGTTQQRFRGPTASRVRKEAAIADNQRLEDSREKLTSRVRQRATGPHHNRPPMQECGMCGSMGHPTNTCPILQEIESSQYHPVPQPGSASLLEEFMKQLTMNNLKFQEDICVTLQDFQTQIGELTTTVNQLHSKRFGHNASTRVIATSEVVVVQPSKVTTVVLAFSNSMVTIVDSVERTEVSASIVDGSIVTIVVPTSANSVVAIVDSVERIEVSASIVDVSDSTKMVKSADCVGIMSDLANIVEVANSVIDVTDCVTKDVDFVLDTSINMTESANSICATIDLADMVKIADFVVDLSNSVKITDSMIDMSGSVDMVKKGDFVVNIFDFAYMIETSDSVANGSNLAKVSDFGTKVLDLVNIFSTDVPDLADFSDIFDLANMGAVVTGAESDSSNQEEAGTDSNNLERANSDSNNQEETELRLSRFPIAESATKQKQSPVLVTKAATRQKSRLCLSDNRDNTGIVESTFGQPNPILNIVNCEYSLRVKISSNTNASAGVLDNAHIAEGVAMQSPLASRVPPVHVLPSEDIMLKLSRWMRRRLPQSLDEVNSARGSCLGQTKPPQADSIPTR